MVIACFAQSHSKCFSHLFLIYFPGADNIILHKFPPPHKQPVRFQQWVEAVGGSLKDLDPTYIYTYRPICHNHFEARYYTRSKMLTFDAVPTLYLTGILFTLYYL